MSSIFKGLAKYIKKAGDTAANAVIPILIKGRYPRYISAEELFACFGGGGAPGVGGVTEEQVKQCIADAGQSSVTLNADGSYTHSDGDADNPTLTTWGPITDGTLVANADGSFTWSPSDDGDDVIIPADADKACLLDANGNLIGITNVDGTDHLIVTGDKNCFKTPAPLQTTSAVGGAAVICGGAFQWTVSGGPLPVSDYVTWLNTLTDVVSATLEPDGSIEVELTCNEAPLLQLNSDAGSEQITLVSCDGSSGLAIASSSNEEHVTIEDDISFSLHAGPNADWSTLAFKNGTSAPSGLSFDATTGTYSAAAGDLAPGRYCFDWCVDDDDGNTSNVSRTCIEVCDYCCCGHEPIPAESVKAGVSLDNEGMMEICSVTEGEPLRPTNESVGKDACGSEIGQVFGDLTHAVTTSDITIPANEGDDCVLLLHFTGATNVVNGSNGSLNDVSMISDSFPAGTLGPWTIEKQGLLTGALGRPYWLAYAPILNAAGATGQLAFDFSPNDAVANLGNHLLEGIPICGVCQQNPFKQVAVRLADVDVTPNGTTPGGAAINPLGSLEVTQTDVAFATPPEKPVIQIGWTHHHWNHYNDPNGSDLDQRYLYTNPTHMPTGLAADDCGWFHEFEDGGPLPNDGSTISHIQAGRNTTSCQVSSHVQWYDTAAGETDYTVDHWQNGNGNPGMIEVCALELNCAKKLPSGDPVDFQQTVQVQTPPAHDCEDPLATRSTEYHATGGAFCVTLAPGSSFYMDRKINGQSLTGGVSVGGENPASASGPITICIPPITGSGIVDTGLPAGSISPSITDELCFDCELVGEGNSLQLGDWAVQAVGI